MALVTRPSSKIRISKQNETTMSIVGPDYIPEPYKVSTITATGSLNVKVDLEKLFEHIPILDVTNMYSNGFTFAEFGMKHGEVKFKGTHKKIAIAAKKKDNDNKNNKKRRFDNQVTMVYKKTIPIVNPPIDYKDPLDLSLSKDTGNVISANMKIFHNGNVQITGLKYIEHGLELMAMMMQFLQLLHNMGIDVCVDIQNMHISNYAIQLINTDFRVGFDIKRDKLYHVLIKDYPKIYKTYEPCIYPGVKIHYKWNDSNQVQGVCNCVGKCKGKGDGHGDGDCKRVTIAVFQSGCIIITGAHNQKQIDDAYMFINNVIRNNFNEVHKKSIEECIAKLALAKKKQVEKDS